MIRVDEEVHEALRALGHTSGSLNNALRAMLQLPEKKTNVAVPANQEAVLNAIFDAVGRHLPSHWAASSAQMRQILYVVAEFRSTPSNLPTRERYARAVRSVADSFGVRVQTVYDKCGRRLYGTGAGRRQSDQFQAALEAIERDLESSGIFDQDDPEPANASL